MGFNVLRVLEVQVCGFERIEPPPASFEMKSDTSCYSTKPTLAIFDVKFVIVTSQRYLELVGVGIE
jgi:hypothetical protein